MTDDNRRELDAFCDPIVARLQRDGPLELQLAHLVAHSYWRLNRIQSIEDGIFALGHTYPKNQIDSGAPRPDVLLSEATTFMRASKDILNITLYESRITRTLKQNMDELRALQTERKAAEEKAQEEAQLLHLLAVHHGQTFDPQTAGFAYSSKKSSSSSNENANSNRLARCPNRPETLPRPSARPKRRLKMSQSIS